MSINLGYVPQQLTVTLVPGDGFASALVAPTPWPVGTVIVLQFGAITWPATIADVTASWNRTPADVKAVLDSGSRSAVLHYTDDTGATVAWARGPVNVL